MFLRLGVALSKLRCTVEKTSGTVTSAGGRERPQRLFGRLKAEKVGSLPPDLVFFPRRLFLPRVSVSPTPKRNCLRHRLKKVQKKKLKGVVSAFFRCLPPICLQEPR